MRFLISRWSVRFSSLFFAAILLSGCVAGKASFDAGEDAMTQGSYDEAVASLLAAVEEDPDNIQYRLRFNFAREEASRWHKNQADSFFEREKYLLAQSEYQLAVDLDGSLFAAVRGVKQATKYLKAEKLTVDAEGLLRAHRRLQAKLVVGQALSLVNDYPPALQLQKKLEDTEYLIMDGVELEVTSNQPITLNFSDAKLPDVFEILSSLSGINFIIDEDVRGNNTTLFLEQASFAQALELLLRMNKLDKKVLNRKTIILFPKTRDKQKQFEDQLIQTFYLSSIDAKKAVNLLRTMLQVRKIYVHEELNAIIIRDKPAVIKLAQKILEANDRSTSEVVFDLELIEVNHVTDQNLGLQLSRYAIDVGMSADDVNFIRESLTAGGVTDNLIRGADGWKDLSPFYSLPSATFNFQKSQADAEILASPQIRVRNKEKAKVHIGTREPVLTTTTSDNNNVSENVQYIDVGVKLDIEPVIQLDNSIVVKVGLEVSNVSNRETTANDTTLITISTTNANTSLTLQDGEQTIMGGLIRDDVTKGELIMPILGDIPFIGKFFNGSKNRTIKREILLSITPHIVKTVDLPEHNIASIWSGGEDDLKFGRNFGTFAEEYSAGQKGLAPQSDPQPVVEKTEPEPVPEWTKQPQTIEGAKLVGPVTLDKMVPVGAVVAEGKATAAQKTDAPEGGIAVVEVPQAAQPANVNQPMVYIKGMELVKVGEPFSLGFYVDEVSELFSAPLYVQYDEKLFEFVSATEGTFLKQGASPTIFTHTALAGSGRIIVGLKQGAGGKGISGGGELFIMNFKAKQAGTGLVEPTRTNFRNPRGVRLKVDSIGLEIEAQ